MLAPVVAEANCEVVGIPPLGCNTLKVTIMSYSQSQRCWNHLNPWNSKRPRKKHVGSIRPRLKNCTTHPRSICRRSDGVGGSSVDVAWRRHGQTGWNWRWWEQLRSSTCSCTILEYLRYGIWHIFLIPLLFFFCNKHSRPSCFGNQFWHRDCRVTAEAALLGHLPFQIFHIFQTWMTLNDRMTKICRIKEHGVYVLLRSSQYGVLHRFSKEKSKHISVGQRGIPTQWDFYKVKTINVYGFRTLEPELDSFISFMQPFYTCTTLSWALTIVLYYHYLHPLLVFDVLVP